MTVRECFESCLIELNKVQAPSLLLDDFNYLINKAILKYFNKRYSQFEVNQQLTDDLRVLVKTIAIVPVKGEAGTGNQMGDSYRVELPEDYVHILNCICEYETLKQPRCSVECTTLLYGAKKLDSNQWPSVITNYYMRPSKEQPYYYISNLQDPDDGIGTSMSSREPDERYGNGSIPVLEIKCGRLNPEEIKLSKVYIDYLRAPKFIKLTDDILDDIEDNSLVLEFPDYVIYEIINELVTICLENGKDPRVLTFPIINQSIPQK